MLDGRRILGALVTALNRVLGVDARQETVQCWALIELVPLTRFGVLFLVTVVALSLLGLLWEAVGNPSDHAAAVGSRRCGPCAPAHGGFFALYTVVPHGEHNT